MSTQDDGFWGSLDNTPKAHFFRGGRSLCKKWLCLGEPYRERNQKTGDTCDRGTCKPCWNARRKEEAAQTAEKPQ